ncbi:MAG TPA: hypothetical protein VH253_15925 [Phycisphaerae bacterium]|nr:hypothetical protein [Phycisphaerae bacterium]
MFNLLRFAAPGFSWPFTVPPHREICPSHHHGYREIPIRYIPLPSGDTLHCSLFIADPNVYPQLTPPTIIASLPTGQTIGFAASPTFLPASTLDRALQSAVSTPAGPATFITSNELQSIRLTHTSLSI